MSAFPSIIIINSPNLKNNWSYPVRTAGNHFVFTLYPSFHDRTTLQSGINIPADGVPKFSTAGHLRSACHSIGIRCEMWQPTTPAQQTSKNFCSHISARCDGGTGGRAAGRDSISTLTSLRDVTKTLTFLSPATPFLLSHLCEM